MADKILNLNELVPDRRIIKLADKEIDVSRIPSRVTFDLIKNSEKLSKETDDSLDVLMGLVVKICKQSCPDITEDWLIDNTDIEQWQALIKFVLEPIQEKIKNVQKG